MASSIRLYVVASYLARWIARLDRASRTIVLAVVAGGTPLAFVSTDRDDDFSGFFTTAAQVFATLLVAIALDARFAKEERERDRPVFALTVGLILLAEVGCLTALGLGLSGQPERVVFAVTFGVGAATLGLVVVIVSRLLAPTGETTTLPETTTLE